MGRFGQTISAIFLGYYTAEDFPYQEPAGVGTDYLRTESNQGAYYPRPGTGSKQSKVLSRLRIVDGSFAKIKNITRLYIASEAFTRKRSY